MLLNNLFSIKEFHSLPDKITVQIKLQPTHKIYSGHFPGNPVTPGVVQMQIVKEILEKNYQKDLRLKSMSKCKFLHVLNPLENPEVNVVIDLLPSGTEIKINAEGKFHEVTFFKLSAIYL